jgi:hypothetical protein
MGEIRVHEFMTLDGVIDAPVWTMDYGFDPRMGEAIADALGGVAAYCWGALPTRCSSRLGRYGLRRTTRAPRS